MILIDGSSKSPYFFYLIEENKDSIAMIIFKVLTRLLGGFWKLKAKCQVYETELVEGPLHSSLQAEPKDSHL